MCQHEHTHSDDQRQHVGRYIPSHWEREEEDQDTETVYVGAVFTVCDDCGEVLDESIYD